MGHDYEDYWDMKIQAAQEKRRKESNSPRKIKIAKRGRIIQRGESCNVRPHPMIGRF
jgi:hypothetical protein